MRRRSLAFLRVVSVLLAMALPLAASTVEVGGGPVHWSRGDGTEIVVPLIRAPGPGGELRAVTVDWRVDGGTSPLLVQAAGRLRLRRGQATASLVLVVRPEAVDAPRRFARLELVRVKGGGLGPQRAVDLEIGGTRIDEEVHLGAGWGPHVALLADGGALVTWEVDGAVRVGRFGPDGHLVRPGISPVRQRDRACCALEPRIFAAPDGGFVLAWLDGDGDRRGVFAQRFDALDRPLGGPFQVASETALEQLHPRFDFAPDGRFLASFVETDQVGSIPWLGAPLFVRGFAADGTPLGPQHRIAGSSIGLVESLEGGGYVAYSGALVRYIGSYAWLTTLGADGAPIGSRELPLNSSVQELAPAGGGWQALTCVGDRWLWVLWPVAADGTVAEHPEQYGDGEVDCGEPVTLLPGRPALLGQFTSSHEGPALPIGLLRVRPDGEGWEEMRLAQVHCLNAGLCLDGGRWSGAVDRARDSVVLAWDAPDGVWIRRFPQPLVATVYARTAGPRAAPGEDALLDLRLAGDIEATRVRFATQDETARAGRDYRATSGELDLLRDQPTPLAVPLLDPPQVTVDTALRVALTPLDPRVSVATPKRAPLFVIRNTVCSDDLALCLLRRTFEVQARWRDANDDERNAVPHRLDDRSGYFAYGAAEDPSVAVKVLGTRQEPTVYWASVSERPTELQVGDDISGRFGWIGDEESCGGGIVRSPYNPLWATSPSAGIDGAGVAPCAPAAGELCLLGGRYAVTGRWENPWDGSQGTLVWRPLADGVALGSYDGGLPEVLVRMAGAENGVLFAAGPLTDFALAFTVRDTASGAVRDLTRPALEPCRIWEPHAF